MVRLRQRGFFVAGRRVRRFLAFGAAALLLLFARNPESPRIEAQGENDVEGTLVVHYEDSYAGGRLGYSLDTGTEHIALAFARNPPRHLRTGTRVRARGARRDRTLLLATGADVSPLGGTASSSSTGQLASPNTFGVQSTLVVLFNFSDLRTEPYTVASARSVTFNEVNDFYLENSFQQTSMQGTAVGWYTIAASSTTCDYDMWAAQAEAAAQNAGVNLALYPRRVFGFPQTSACGWWGLGTIGGGTTTSPSRAWINGVYTLRVVSHEMGHNFGLFHSRSNTCTAGGCVVDEYGDDHDIMGGATGHFNAYQKERVGWLNNGSSPPIETVNGSGQYTLEPYATPWGGRPKALKILKSSAGGVNTYVYAEARTQYGADTALAPGVLIHTGTENDGSQIYEEDLLPSTSDTDFILDPGQSVTFNGTAPAVTLTALSFDGTGAVLSIAGGCSYSLASTRQSIGSAGGPGSVAMTTAADCGWTAASNDPWITVNSGSTTGTGSSTIQLTVAPNPNASLRTGTLTIGDQTYTVTQAGASCVYTVSPLNPAINYTPTSYALTVTAPAGCTWIATSDTPTWITVTGGSSGTGNGTVTYSVTSNSGSHASRTGTLTVAGETVTVVQEGSSALIIQPGNGATNVATTKTFFWTPVQGASNYQLLVGTSPGGSDVADSGELPSSAQSYIVNGMPGSRLLYARIRTKFTSPVLQWTISDITFTTNDRVAAVQVLGAQMPNPVGVGGSVQYGANAGTSVKVSFTGSAGGCTATLAASGLPTGATATFAPSSVVSSATNQFTLLSIVTTTATLPGNYVVTVSATESSACSGSVVTTTTPLVVIGTSGLTTAAASGTYGGSASLSATLMSGGSPVGGRTITFTLNGNAVGTAVTNATGVATLANASLTGVAAGSYPSGVSASFAGDATYGASTGTSTLTVSQKPVTPAVTASSKTYDGTTSATLTGCTLTGVIGSDVVTCAGSATFASATVGAGKTVTASGLTLSGAAAGNYSLSTTTATTTATIAARPVTPAVTVADKVYDGTTSATLTSCTLTGLIVGDVVSCTGTAAFATATAGASKPVTVTGITFTGAVALNYALTTTTATTTATISASAGPTPVAAYGFNEGSGTSATDASGTGNTGSITNAAWTAAGKYGGALSFGGNGTVVTIPDAPSLHLTTAMTLEAWVNPSAVTGDWEDVIYKGDDTFYLEAMKPGGAQPVAGGTWAGNANLQGSGPLPLNTWTHLAATYDAAQLRLYVNGTQVASVARSGAFATSTYPLQIGGDSLYGQYFAGLIDDVRVYNVALTAAQIQTDMNTPVGGVATTPDVTVTKTHAGAFTQGQTGATYTITVRNVGTGPTSGTVTVVDTLPGGLTAATLAGTGWSCTVTTATCTRSDALGAGASYPVLTITVTVASSAPPSVTNQVTVSGGGDTTPANDSASDPTTITPAAAAATSLSLAAANGVYGGTSQVSATLTASGLPVSGKSVAFTLLGVAVGTVVTNASGVATLTSVSLSGIAAGSYATGVGASFAGDASYSASSGSSALTVSQKPVTPAVTASNKTYDGTASATITSCTLTGVIGGDVVTCAGSATFASASVGAGKTVTASGLTLSGASAGNYSLTTTTATTTASITTATLTAAVTAANKAYDSSTSATLTGCTLSGVIGGDVVTCAGSATFASAAVGAGKTVTASGLTLSGASAGNYALSTTTATTTASITTPTLTAAVTAANKVYDGTMSATLTSCALTGVIGGDVVTCAGSATFASAAVGAGKTVTASGLTLSGASAGNYALSTTTATTTANITAATLTAAVTVANKAYDGTTSATLTGCTLTGVIGGDVVTCNGTATFATVTVGVGKPVIATGIALAGPAAGNYALSTTTATTTATVAARPLSPAVTAANKVYDGSTGATLTSCTLTGLVVGDLVSCTGTAAFATATAGANKPVTVTGITLTGAAALNYALTTTTATTTATISALAGPTPVAAYAFNEGSGTTAADASGTGNTGSITDGTWTASGKYGGALAFDGNGTMVTIPDAPSLHLTTAMTLEAWVNPSAMTGAWADVIYKGADTYYLEGMTPGGAQPVAGGTWTGNLNLFGSVTLPLNAWTHLASTYDGAMLRLYVNGTEVASAAQSGGLAASTHPLEIGGDSLYGQYFAGLIDEVRVYDVALTAAQIQNDMNTPTTP